MPKTIAAGSVPRRTILKAGLALGAMQVAGPFVVKALADEPVKIGLDNADGLFKPGMPAEARLRAAGAAP